MNRPKLGKLPKKHDPRTLQLAKYLDAATLPVVPNEQNWLLWGPKKWGMMGNDQLGDCTCAALGHLVQQWTANSRGKGHEITVPDAAVVEMYSRVGGYVPGKPETDRGAYCLDALKDMRKTGLSGHKILAFAEVNPRHHAMVRAACLIGTGLYLGATLHESIWSQDVWDVPPAGDQVAGGHAISVGIVGGRLEFVTWGARQPATWGWWDHEVDECYCVISEDSLTAARKSAIGLDLDALLADLKLVTA